MSQLECTTPSNSSMNFLGICQGMVTEEHKKESISRAYVQAVAARAGINLNIGDRTHDYGIDGHFHQVSLIRGKRVETGHTLHFQLKSTTKFIKKSNHVHYELDASTYNMLTDRAKRLNASPAILLLLCIPEKHDDQFCLTENELTIRNCCYWHTITEEPTENSESVTIKMPRKRLFTPEALTKILHQIAQGENVG